MTNDLDEYAGVSVSADSRTLVTTRTEHTSAVWLTSPAATNSPEPAHPITNATATRDGWDALGWTPDNRIIYSSLMSGSAEIWIMDSNGAVKRRLTDSNSRNHAACVSHDGQFIMCTSNRSGGTNLWRFSLDGTDVRQMTQGDSEMLGQLSPDDKWIVYISIKTGRRLLHKISVDGAHDTILSEIPAFPYPPALSPDGKWIAFGFNDPHRRTYRLSVIPFAGGTPITIFDVAAPTKIEWTHDGKALTYTSAQDGIDNLWVQALTGGAPQQITNFNEGRIFRFAWRWDGKLLAIVRGQETSDIVALQRTD